MKIERFPNEEDLIPRYLAPGTSNIWSIYILYFQFNVIGPKE